MRTDDFGAMYTWHSPEGTERSGEEQPKKPSGSAVMGCGIISGFGAEMGTLIGTGAGQGGYWTSDRIIEWFTDDVLPTLTSRYKGVELVLMVDNSSNHLAMGINSLDATKPNLQKVRGTPRPPPRARLPVRIISSSLRFLMV